MGTVTTLGGDPFVTAAQCVEVEVHRFTTEASQLGFPPGKWPSVIETTMGNRQPFGFVSRDERDGEIVAVRYRQFLGCITLTVFND